MDSQNSFDEFVTKYKLPLIIGLVGLVLLIGGIISSGLIPKTFVKSSTTSSANQTKASSTVPLIIKVDVSGAVVNPGVYSLPNGSRVEEAVKAAGGVSPGADPQYLSKTINLAQKISDGMKIYIPQSDEKLGTQGPGDPPAGVGGVAANSNQLININTASISELDRLPGVGAVTAQKIIDKRPYNGIEELFTKKAVTSATFAKIKDLVSTW